MNIRSISLFIISLLSHLSFAQSNANPHFFKLIIENERSEMILIKYEGVWEIPGSRYSRDISITEFVKQMGLKHGVEIDSIKLKTLVTFHHDVRDTPTMMFYFKAKYQSGELLVPSWGEDLAWAAPNKAYQLIPFPEINYIIQNISDSNLLQGAFRIIYDPETKERKGFEIIKELKKLN